MKAQTLIFISLFLMSLMSCNQNENKVETGTELNLEVSSDSLEVFGEGFVSTGLYERDIAISPDGNEIIYTIGDYKQAKRCLAMIKKVEGKWTAPKMLNISGTYQDIEPFYFDNGNTLYFASNRPLDEGSERTDYNIWYSKRESDQWTAPKALTEKINTEGDEFYPSLGKSGNLYFTATRADGIGKEDIFLSQLENGEYQEPMPLDTSINSQFYEFNAYVNPEENMLIFSSYGRADGLGGGDLYMSQKDENGHWAKAQNMGDKINSPKLDYCPFIDSKHKNFYFTSERLKATDKELQNLKDLTEYANSVQNGMGDIYKISLEALELK